jgi:DNA-binding response OmpR family regulator
MLKHGCVYSYVADPSVGAGMTDFSSTRQAVPGSQRVLVVDDDPAILQLVGDKLERAGYEVCGAASGQQALEVIERRGLPHLAIVDINMPGMDGFEFRYALDPVMQVDERLGVDFAQQSAIIDGRAVSLTPTESKLLYILMRNAGRIVSTEFLLRRLWPLEEVFEDTLRVHVYRVRQKIEADPAQPRYIVTERGLGYSFLPQS